MARIGVPPTYLPSIRRFGDLEDDVVAAIVDGATAVRSVPELQNVIGATTEAEPRECRQMVAALLAMAQVRHSRRETPEEFAQDLSEDEDLALPDDQRVRFRTNLTALLGAEGVRSLGRAADVSTEHDKVFIDSRVLTDLRPVFPREFADDDPAVPDGVVLVHSLKLLYQQDGAYHQFYIALDDLDLDALVSTLQRASKKAEGLRELLASNEIPEFVLGGD